MKKLSRMLALVLALCLALPVFALAEDAPAATDVPAATEAPVVEDPVLFTLDGKEYLKSEVDNILYSLYSNGYVESMTDYATAMQYMIEDEVIIAKIKELGLDQFTEDEEAAFLTEAQAEWDTAIESYVSYFLSEDTEEARAQARQDGEAYYTSMGYSVDMLVENLKMNAGFDLLQAQMFKDLAPVTEEEIKAVFEEYAAQDKASFENDFYTYEAYQQYYGYESWYKPEGFRGIIHILLEVDEELLNAYTTAQALYEETLSAEEPAEGDFQSHTTGAAMNAMRDSINEMRQERGEPPLSEEELPTEPDDAVYRWWWYYDHVLRDLSRRHDEGEIPERGMVAWY